MNDKNSQLPQDIYHRLYWYAKRNVDPARIATALNLPLKTVQHVVGKLAEEKKQANSPEKGTPAEHGSAKTASGDFLDLFLFTKTRYSVMDISGSLNKKHIQHFRETFLKLAGADRKPLALKLTDVSHIDETGVHSLKTLHAGIVHQDRYCAILDPGAAIEPILKQYGIDSLIPIFGTELAFEEHAFR
ncbi:MAG TPA: STAS domain-containing protein [Chitinivibrionales bacterium]